MKIQLDTTNKTVTLLEDVDFQELTNFLNSIVPNETWKIIGNTLRVPTEDKSLWKELRDVPTKGFKDFTNPLPNPYVNPILPYTPLSPTYPHGTGDPILWCGEGTTQAGHDFDVDYMKRNGLCFSGTDPINENVNKA